MIRAIRERVGSSTGAVMGGDMRHLAGAWVALLVLAVAYGCGDSANAHRAPERERLASTTSAPGLPGSAAIQGGQPNNRAVPAGMGGPTQAPAPVQTLPEAALGECGMISIAPDITFHPGNLLVIFDRSISMSEPFPNSSGMISRLASAREAIHSALQPLACPEETNPDGPGCTDPLSVALLTFPTYDGVNGIALAGGGRGRTAATAMGRDLSCTVEDLDSDEQMPWMRVTEFVASFEPYWESRTHIDGGELYPGMHPLMWGTPISVAFARADEALMDPAVVGNKAVLFLTDGQETGDCMGGDVVAFAQKWHDMGIRTHVVSLASSTGSGQQFNDMVAATGGTMQSLYPADSASLSQEISTIVGENRGSVMCEITIQDAQLTNATMACEEGRVLIQGLKVPCDQANKAEGFYVKDEQTFEVVGSYCMMLQSGLDLRADFPCELLAPQ
ncbi:MAG: hypothetical protein OXU20_33085 [Myxococcales bacterium]|nr:hypothetical protein [Myxococcales bacterium]